MRTLSALALGACLVVPAVAGPVLGQEVEVSTLTAPDVFSGGARDTGLGPDLWRTTSAPMARRIIPLIGVKPLSPAASDLALRLLSTGANAPPGAGDDRALAGARGEALLRLGDADAANASVERIPNLTADAALARTAAEAALIVGDDSRACGIGETLNQGRGEAYWLKLRAYCQAIGGEPDAAQLTLTLANEKGRDKVFTRLMTALLLGNDPGGGSWRTGLELALSRRLNIAPVKGDLDEAPPAIASHFILVVETPVIDPANPAGPATSELPAELALALPPPPEMMATDPVGAARQYVRAGDIAQARIIRGALVQDEVPGARVIDLDLLDALIAAASGEAPGPVLDALVVRASTGGAKSPAIAAAAYLLALGAPMDGEARDAFSQLDLGKVAISPAKLTALTEASTAGRKGETALLVLSIAAEAGKAGPAPADRAVIIRALRQAGLTDDARAFAVEGLLALSGK